MREARMRLPKDAYGAVVGYVSPSSLPPNPKPSTIEASVFRLADQAAQEIIRRIQPTEASVQRRKLIVEYMKNLSRGSVGFETFTFGSFPLMTYLPDGDIDLTVIGKPSIGSDMASVVRTILEREEKNTDSEFKVKDIKYIGAQVEVVSCLVQNIMVDITFNQIGGLCTLCFFEQADRFIGKDHLFKRSIILIKAWSYYESRILGSHHSLISTYALETLVLYIFHFFHSSLGGPLSVLYRFLDYYSKFDWDKYCITLQGPALLSSLPELSVETVDNDGGDLLLTEEFVRSCVDFFSVPTRVSEGESKPFAKKFLNIVDPLREDNNLGRSVGQGNSYRIRSAFMYGARKLGQVLLLPPESIGEEVNKLFMNTLDRNAGEKRPDLQDWIPRSARSAMVESSGAELTRPVENLEKERADELSSESSTSKAHGDLDKEMESIRISSEPLTGEAKDLATSRTSVSKSVAESPNASSSSTKEDSILYVPSIRASSSSAETDSSLTNTGDVEKLIKEPPSLLNEISDLSGDEVNKLFMNTLDRNAGEKRPDLQDWIPRSAQSALVESSGAELTLPVENLEKERADELSSESSTSKAHGDLDKEMENCRISSEPPTGETKDLVTSRTSVSKSVAESPNTSSSSTKEDSILYVPSIRASSSSAETDSSLTNTGDVEKLIKEPPSLLNEISDLSGDYDMQLDNLNFAVWCREMIAKSYVLPMYQSPSNAYQLHDQNVLTQGNIFLTAPSPSPKPRGLGTFFPKPNYQAFKELHSPVRVKITVPENHPSRSPNTFQADAPQDSSSAPEPAIRAQPVFGGTWRGKLPAPLDIPESSSGHGFRVPSHSAPEYGKIEFGSFGPVSLEAPTKVHGRKPDSPISRSQGSGFTSPAASTSLRPALSSNWGRKSQSYQLKDEDFPPL